ncbi:class F sortase [Nocardioides marmoraquaticus]
MLLLGLALLLATAAWAVGRSQAAPVATPAPAPQSPAATSGPTSSPSPLEVQGETAAGAAPERVRVPRAGIDVGVEDLRTDARGRLGSPRDWQRAGWFTTGAAPGDVGPAVVAGHVDSPTGPAAFTGLDALRPGDEVVVDRADGSSVTFAVDRTEVVDKGAFPTAEVYGPTPDAQLRLITCDGPYVSGAGGYQDNLVVFATVVGR